MKGGRKAGASEVALNAPTPHKPRFSKESIKENIKFDVIFNVSSNCPLSSKKLIYLFKIVATLGGLGNRSRRGFGAFTITRI